MTAPAGALSVFHHYRSSDRSPQEHYLYFPTATAVSAPAGALSTYFLTAAAVLAPAGAFPPVPSPSPPPPSISSLPQQCLLQQEPLPPAPPLSPSQQPHATIGIPPPSCFLHCRSSACSSRNLLYIFPTAAAVPAPTGIFSIFPHCPSSDCSRRSTIYFPTTAVVSAPAGALSISSHCRSSACPRRSFLYVSPLPQQCLLPQERYLYFLTTAVVTAPP